MQFEGKSAIVTGAASGIGLAVARKLASGGAHVFLADRNAEALEEATAEIGGRATAHAFDVSDPQACEALVAAAVSACGGLDYLCNIAGVLDMAPLADTDPARWQRMIDINLGGTFHMCRAAMPHLIERRGNIVNMASAAGLVGVPFNSAYVASKHGVVGLTRALALEFARAGIRINAVCPSGVKTPMIANPQIRPGIDWELVMRGVPWLDDGELCEPEDVADAVIFLLSDQARRITGVAFPVDGGHTAN